MSRKIKILVFVLIFASVIVFSFAWINLRYLLTIDTHDAVRFPNARIWNLNRAPKFEDFQMEEVFYDHPAKVDIYSSSSAKEFRSALRYAIKGGSNFAGHYAVAEWGCGSTCQDGMIIDVSTGKVYDPFVEPTVRGVDYKLDSNLFITNPYSDDTPLVDEILKIPVKYYVWKDNKLLQIYQEECYLVNDNKYICK